MARAPVVLIVSEHEWASRSLDTVLAPMGYAVLRAFNGEQALKRAAVGAPDAVFIERTLPDITGPGLCRKMLSSGVLSPATPMFLTTPGAVSHDQRLEALRAGAWEVFTLPMDAEELLLRVTRYTRAKLEADRTRGDSMTDPETGLYNEAGLLQRVREAAAAAERYERPLACIVFEPVGQQSGFTSEMLAEIVRVLRSSTRRSDIVGRIGPTQFAIVAPDTPEDGARVVADRLRRTAAAPDEENTAKARAGVFAVANGRELRFDATEMVLRAAIASREPGGAGLN